MFLFLFLIYFLAVLEAETGDSRCRFGAERYLDMLKSGTKNEGILAAIKEVRVMSLGKTLRLMYEARLKEIRDRDAREDYVWNEGLAQGLLQGENRLNSLHGSLIADKRFEDFERSITDNNYREQLYKEYKIKD